MRIVFEYSFSDVSEKELQISRKDVIRTVTNPLRKQRILFDDYQEILLFLQKEERSESYLLIMGHRKDNAFHVGGTCFRIPTSLLKQAMTDEPISLLQQLALNFGVSIRVGQRTGRFFFREKIPVTKDTKSLDLMQLSPPRASALIASLYYRLIPEGYAEIAVVFSIALKPYLSWLRKEIVVQISSKTYDVLISYKRNTAKDYALHLKTSLTDEGFRAFVDLDIPKELEGTERWFDIRDAAILNSRRFLLIITAGIETSREISKELSLARTIPKMKFIYLRHEDLKPKMTIIGTNGETIRLSDGNQISFGTAEDLARKVLGILSRTEEEG